MPRRRILPASHDDRFNLLTTALATAISDRAHGRYYLPQEWVNATETFLPIYRAKIHAIALAAAAQGEQIARRDATTAKLEQIVRHAWIVEELRDERLELSGGLRDLYGIPNYKPRSLTPQEWVSRAEAFITGDQIAVSEGYPAMCNPSAAEIQAILTLAQEEIGKVSSVAAALDDAQEAAQAAVPRAMELITDLIDYLEFALRKESPSSQRQEMRRYGLQYRSARTKPQIEDSVHKLEK